jgi:hypothetical protein
MPANKKYSTEEERKEAIRKSQRKRNKNPERIAYMKEYKKRKLEEAPGKMKALYKEYSKRAKEKLISKIGKEEYDRRRREASNKRRAENREIHMLYDAKKRAKKKCLEFNIEVTDIIIPEMCPVLGIKLEFGKGKQTDASPSLDRIDPREGYIKGNVAVISYRANTIKSNACIDELERIIDYMRGCYGLVRI